MLLRSVEIKLTHWHLSCFPPVVMPIRIKLTEGFLSIFMLTIMQGYGGEVCRMVNKFSCSAKLGIHIPQLYWWFMHNIIYKIGSFLWPDFQDEGPSCCISTILYQALHFRSHLLVCLFLNKLYLLLENLVQDILLSSVHF